MLNKTVKLIFFFSPILLIGQNSSNSSPVYDTVQVYNCSYGIIRDGDSTYYEIDGKLVSKEECEKVRVGFRNQKKCNPCVLKKFNLDGSLDSQGVFYYTCPGSDEKSETRHKKKDTERAIIRINSCNDGEWLFYSKDGKLVETKFFVHGQELKDKGTIVH